VPSRRETIIAQNEVLFRQVNERRREDDPGTVVITCECGDLDCHDQLRVEAADYEAVRANPRRFLGAPGHEIPDVEKVVEKRETYQVIEKPPSVDEVVDR
jgi:hypothetical protein